MDLKRLSIENIFKLMEERQPCFSLIEVEDATIDDFVERLDYLVMIHGLYSKKFMGLENRKRIFNEIIAMNSNRELSM